MSILFTESAANNVNHGNVAVDPTASSFCGWFYFPSLATVTCRVVDKSASTGATGYWRFQFGGPGTAGAVRFVMDYSTTDANATSVDNVLTANTWQFIAITFDGVLGPKIYVGSLSRPASEVAYRSVPAVPSGTRVTDAGASFCVGSQSNATQGPGGRCAGVNFITGAVLSLPQILLQQVQLWPHPMSRVLSIYGRNGLGLQPDFSGAGNNGSVLASAIAEDLPPMAAVASSLLAAFTVVPVGGGGNFTLNVTDSMPLSEALGRAAARSVTEAIAPTDTISKRPGRTAFETISIAETLAKRAVTRSLTDAVTVSEIFAAIAAKLLALVDGFAVVDTIRKSAARQTSESFAVAESLVKRTTLSVLDTLGLSEAVSHSFAKLLGLVDVFSILDTLTTLVGRVIGSISGVRVVINMPSMACSLGTVESASLWGSRQPSFHAWKQNKPPAPRGWKTTNLPDKNSGTF